MKGTDRIRLKDILATDRVVYGPFIIEFDTDAVVRCFAASGWDYVLADMEHTSLDLQQVGRIIGSSNRYGLSCLVRVPTLRREYISRALDLGADGVMVPRIEGPEDVRNFKAWAKYPPEGDRGFALLPSHIGIQDFNGEHFCREENRKVLLIGQIETEKAVKNLNAILDEGGLDVVFVGPYDLSASMGMAGKLYDERVLSNIDLIIQECQSRGIVPGIFVGDPDTAKFWRDRGMKFISCGSELFMMSQAAAEFRNAVGR